MATLKDIRDTLDNRIETIPDVLFESVGVVQDDLLRSLTALIDQLDTTDGKVITSSNNSRILGLIDAEINRVLFGENAAYLTAISTYAGEVVTQGALIKEYYKTAFSRYTDKDTYQQIIRNVATSAIDQLTQSSVDAAFNKPLKNILNQSFTTGISRTQLNNTLRDFVKGTDEVDGQLLRYTKQIGRDAFSAADRQVNVFIGEDLGIQFYLYSGNVIKDSRKFCLSRAGKYYHKNEIASWANLDWQGKVKNTNESTIFTLLGGYNCLHILIPVDVNGVPPDELQRAIDLGYYKPN